MTAATTAVVMAAGTLTVACLPSLVLALPGWAAVQRRERRERRLAAS